MNKWTASIRRRIEENQNVNKVTEKNISFKPEFKALAVQKASIGLTSEQILREAGLPQSIFPKDYFRLCIRRWRLKTLNDGADSLARDDRGMNRKGQRRPDTLEGYSVEELKAIVNFQSDFIEELKKMKALAKRKSSKA